MTSGTPLRTVQTALFDRVSDTAPARIPHPIPYQGSKRQLASEILALIPDRKFRVFHEPFVGSGAVSLAAASANRAEGFALADSLPPLVDIWHAILGDPLGFADSYETLWLEQLPNPRDHFLRVRHDFNVQPHPTRLLYLLARCVKNSPRFNKYGDFNQSADHRRRGMHPDKMRRNLIGASTLLQGRTVVAAADFEDMLAAATPDDFVYMDPPYAGTSYGTDRRYHQGVEQDRLIAALHRLAHRGVPYVLSYDGRCGVKEYTDPLPVDFIRAHHLELVAGRSSQSTLAGRDEVTVESLYVSESLLRDGSMTFVGDDLSRSRISLVGVPLPRDGSHRIRVSPLPARQL